MKKRLQDLAEELGRKRKDFLQLCKFNIPGIISARNYANSLKDTFYKRLKTLNLSEKNWCLIGIGGFGRKELSFYSDLDILFLYQDKLKKELQEFIKNLVQSLWDKGFEVGHRVLKPQEIEKIIKEDFLFLTSILETEFLAGDKDFYTFWKDDFFKSVISSKKEKTKFLSNLIGLREKRFEKYGDSSYIIEPHIKEGKGGLRDVHTIKWLSIVFFNTSEIEKLVSMNLFLNIEREWLSDAEDFLWKVRLQLHRLTKRGFDRLTLQYQKEIAPFFVLNKDHKISTEEFMEQYFRHCARIRRLTDLLIEKVNELENHKTKSKVKKIGYFLIIKNHIKFANPLIIPYKPELLMEIFWWMAKLGVHFHHETGQVIRKNLSFFSAKYLSNKKIISQFFDILMNKKSGFQTLYTMMETGFLDKFLPEFSHIRYKVQYDTYHTYTVDEHLLRTVKELHQMEDEDKYRPFFEKVKRYKRILLLAGLLHDIGKGYGKDHAALGASFCKNIAVRFGLKSDEIDVLSFLVEKHLFMIHLALKRDLSEERPIETLALEVENKEKLYLLYLLTIADSRATGPSAWNLWRSQLLDELLIKTENFLSNQGIELKNLQKRLEEKKSAVLNKAPLDLKEDLSKWIKNLSLRYLLNTSVDDILLHFELERDLKEKKLIILPKRLNSEVAEVTIVCYDRKNLFDIITGIFWVYGLNILSANIYTRPTKVVVDKIVVQNIPDLVNWDRLWGEIKKEMLNILEGKTSLEDLLSRRQVRKIVLPKRFSISNKKNNVEINNKASDFYTVIEIHTWDRPGLLLKISKTLHSFDLDIAMAKISTLGSHVADIFYVTKDGRKILQKEVLDELKHKILKVISEE